MILFIGDPVKADCRSKWISADSVRVQEILERIIEEGSENEDEFKRKLVDEGITLDDLEKNYRERKLALDCTRAELLSTLQQIADEVDESESNR